MLSGQRACLAPLGEAGWVVSPLGSEAERPLNSSLDTPAFLSAVQPVLDEYLPRADLGCSEERHIKEKKHSPGCKLFTVG